MSRLDPLDVQHRVEEILALTNYNASHEKVISLYEDLIEAIAKGNCKDPRLCCDIVSTGLDYK
jgi:hypothetical protein